MSNKATKQDAARLILLAKRQGWKISSDTMRNHDDGRVWNVQVSMTKTLWFSNGLENLHRHVLVSFRKARKCWVVSIAVPHGKKTYRGWWHANYALKEMAETEIRQAARDAQRQQAAA